MTRIKYIIGSAKDLLHGERERAKLKILPPNSELVQLGDDKQDCLAILRNFFVLD